jgi:hypothetical protein
MGGGIIDLSENKGKINIKEQSGLGFTILRYMINEYLYKLDVILLNNYDVPNEYHCVVINSSNYNAQKTINDDDKLKTFYNLNDVFYNKEAYNSCIDYIDFDENMNILIHASYISPNSNEKDKGVLVYRVGNSSPYKYYNNMLFKIKDDIKHTKLQKLFYYLCENSQNLKHNELVAFKLLQYFKKNNFKTISIKDDDDNNIVIDLNKLQQKILNTNFIQELININETKILTYEEIKKSNYLSTISYKPSTITTNSYYDYSYY